MSLVWEHYPAGGGELLTALAYADHAHDDGSGIRPSIAYIAKKTRQSERTVQRYVAEMRGRKWLLTVRRADGGRGYATEYRVNPLWITNPDRLSPFEHSDEKRVTSEVKKGDTGGMKRVTPVSSQPSLTIKEPTTTGFSSSEPVANQGVSLNWPSVFHGSSAESAACILNECPIKDRQGVLDEVAGLVLEKRVRYPLGLLKKLVERAGKGLFVPSAAIAFRERNREPKTYPAEPLSGDARQSTPETRKAALAELAVLREEIAGKGFAQRHRGLVKTSWRKNEGVST